MRYIYKRKEKKKKKKGHEKAWSQWQLPPPGQRNPHLFIFFLYIYFCISLLYVKLHQNKIERFFFFLIYRCSLLFVKLHQSKIERKYFLFYQCSLKFKLINEKKNKCKGKKLNKQTFLLKRKKKYDCLPKFEKLKFFI